MATSSFIDVLINFGQKYASIKYEMLPIQQINTNIRLRRNFKQKEDHFD